MTADFSRASIRPPVKRALSVYAPPEDTPVTLVEVGQCARNCLSYIGEGTGIHLMRGETMTIKQVAERVAEAYGARVEVA